MLRLHAQKSSCFKVMPMLRSVQELQRRHLLTPVVHSIFNAYDHDLVERIGPDLAAAQWLLRCGACIKWKGQSSLVTHYNILPPASAEGDWFIEEIDATDSLVSAVGFDYVTYLRHVRSIHLERCTYLSDAALDKLQRLRSSLLSLSIITCGNITDTGVLGLEQLANLRRLSLFEIPDVTRERVLHHLQRKLPKCTIQFPPIGGPLSAP